MTYEIPFRKLGDSNSSMAWKKAVDFYPKYAIQGSSRTRIKKGQNKTGNVRIM
jgi:hypothetical protein